MLLLGLHFTQASRAGHVSWTTVDANAPQSTTQPTRKQTAQRSSGMLRAQEVEDDQECQHGDQAAPNGALDAANRHLLNGAAQSLRATTAAQHALEHHLGIIQHSFTCRGPRDMQLQAPTYAAF